MTSKYEIELARQAMAENRKLRERLREYAVAFVAGCLALSIIYLCAYEDTRTMYKEMASSAETVASAAAADAKIWRAAAERYKTEAEEAAQAAEVAQIVGAEYIGEFSLTAYCCEKYEHICGEGHGITSSGQPVQAGVTVAADPSVLPYGTVLYIEGVGIRIVQDKGAAIKGNELDVAVDTHENALRFGAYGEAAVYILSTPEAAQ